MVRVSRISAPTMVGSMRIESSGAERFDRQEELEIVFLMMAFTCAVNVRLTSDCCRISAASAVMVHPFPGASRWAVLRCLSSSRNSMNSNLADNSREEL